MHQLTNYFQQFLPFTDDEAHMVEERTTTRSVKRRQMILQPGFVCRHYTFVVEGCFRMYGVDEKGKEHNIQFAAAGDWIADIGSFHTQKNSRLFIEALEPSVVFQLEQQDLYFLYTNIPKLDRIFKVIIENKYVELQNHVLQNISSSAQQRYISFLDQYPHLANRLPNVHIASYLGITPEFLSKVRKDMAAGQ